MTVDEAWKSITSDPLSQRTRMILTIISLCLEDWGQYDAAEWCVDAAGQGSPGMESAPAIWRRAVAVLRLPADVRAAAKWN
jgi:hypothetical protein